MVAIHHLNLVTVMMALKLQQQKKKKKQPRPRRVWVQPYLQRRVEQGHYHNLMQELSNEVPELFKNFTRMENHLFDHIVDRVTPIIEKKHTYYRKPLDPGLRVAITLRFLATGDSYYSLGYAFRVAHNTISGIVP